MLGSIIDPSNVRSGGFIGPGRLAAKKVREYADGLGYDLSVHRSKLTTLEDAEWADVIMYMDQRNLGELRAAFPGIDNGKRLVCLGSWVGVDRIPDPGYLPRGDRLRGILGMVVTAALAAGDELG